MARGRTVAKWIGGILLALLAVVIIAVVVLTQTRWGHERVRRFALDILRDQVNGIVLLGDVSGNLLQGFTLHDLSILTSDSQPFISIERAHVRYGLRALLDQQILLSELELVNPLVVLDRPPGGEWNFERLFPEDTTAAPDTTIGWGDWIVMQDVTIRGGRFIVKMPWEPDDDLPAAARDSAAAAAVAGEGRTPVVAYPGGGYQRVMEFESIQAALPLVRLAHPRYDARLIDIAGLEMTALAFRPPAAQVDALRGTFRFTGDSLWFTDAVARLPDSFIRGDGKYVYETERLVLDLHGESVALADLQWLYPRLPSTGQGTLDFQLLMTEDTVRYLARDAVVRVRDAILRGRFGLTDTETGVYFHDTDLAFSELDLALIEQLVPDLELRPTGELTGDLVLAGPPGALRVDADVRLDSPETGVSHVVATGMIGVDGGVIRADDLRIRLDPLQVELAELFVDSLPIAGELEGTAILNGSTATRLAARFDLALDAPTGRSHLIGEGALRLAGDRTWIDLDARATPVSLATLSPFVPLDLRGYVSGPIAVRGTLDDLSVEAELDISAGGALAVEARLGLAGPVQTYRIGAAARLFNVNAVLPSLPRTSLSATVLAEGRGFDPATMNAVLAANLTTSLWDSVALDSGVVRVAVTDGLLRVDRLQLDLPDAQLTAEGTFGLVAGREGTLVYRAQVDSLSEFARWLPADTGVVRPRPAAAARAMARARADSARRAAATEVERAVTGAPGPPLAAADTPTVLARDSISGSIRAAGVLRGSVAQFDARGRLAARNLTVSGNRVEQARVQYAILGGGTRAPRFIVGANVDSASVFGFYFDSVQMRVAYEQPGGTALVLLYPNDSATYSANTEFTLDVDENELRLADVRLTFDTTAWVSTHPAAVRWGGQGVVIDSLELISGEAGRIFVDGRLPTDGNVQLSVEIAGFQVANAITLLQTDLRAAGILSLDAVITGTTRQPRISGEFLVLDGSFQGTPIPHLRGELQYASQRLRAEVAASREGGVPFAVAQGTIPINLSLAANTGPRFPQAAMDVRVQLDSLPLGLVPPVTDAVSRLSGSLYGTVVARGPVRDPRVVGAVALRGAALRVNPLGIYVQNVHGQLRLEDDVIVIDSLVGRSRGTIRIVGTVGVEEWTNPVFELRLLANNAYVLRSDDGEFVADAQLGLEGPLDSPYVFGRATILRGVLYVPEPEGDMISPRDPALFNVVDTSAVAVRELLPEGSPLLEALRMDVVLDVNRGTWVRTSEANVEVYGDLTIHMDQRSEELVVEGFLNTERGEYTFLARRFDITRGTAIFIGSPDINPTLQITGEYAVPVAGRQALTIRVLIGGTLENPRLSLESDAQPPIPQSDLISYLAFGRASASLLQTEGTALSGGTPGSALAGIANLAGRQIAGVALGTFANELEGDALRELGADVFNISPADLPPDVVDDADAILKGTELEVGKYTDPNTFVAIQGRLALTTPGATIQRRFGDGWRVEATYGTRYIRRAPSLAPEDARPDRVFGLFLIREWRFSSPSRLPQDRVEIEPPVLRTRPEPPPEDPPQQ